MNFFKMLVRIYKINEIVWFEGILGLRNMVVERYCVCIFWDLFI